MKAQKQSALQTAIALMRFAAGVYLVWLDARPAKPSPLVRHANDESGPLLPPPLLPAAEGKPVEPASASAVASASTPAKAGPFWKRLWGVAVAAAKAWSVHRAASKGAALALYTLFSLAPMLVLVVAVAGLVFGEDTVRESLVQQMSGLMGTEGADAIKTMLGGDKEESSGFLASAISAVLVLVSATTAFAELKNSLDELWEVPPSTESGLWSLIHERFLSFGMILVLALMMLASLAVSAGLAAMGNLWGSGEDSAFRWVLLVLSNLFSFAVITGLFAAIFKYLPAVKIPWKDVIVGAVLTAILFIVGKFLIGLYVANVDISSGYGAAGSVVILITWIFYSAQIFFYGALFTHEYAVQMGSRAGRAALASGNKKPAEPEAERV